MNSIYNIDINFNNDIINMIYDIIKFSTIQLITHLLFCFNNSSISFFNLFFFQTVIFISLGLMVYWLIIRKLISFKNKNEIKNKTINKIISK